MLPEPPEHISDEAKREWQRTGERLQELGLITQLDGAAFAAYCQAYGRWAEAEEQIKKFGTVIKAPSGFLVQSPYLAIANKSMEQMTKMLVEFGMTPSSRSRVTAIEGQQEADPFARFERRG